MIRIEFKTDQPVESRVLKSIGVVLRDGVRPVDELLA